MKLQGSTAVITGAAGGIGQAVAQSLARRGCHLALIDIDAARLAASANAIAASGVSVKHYILDITDANAVKALPDQIMANHPGVDLLVNNAGVALAGTFEQVAEADFEWLFAINFWGVVRMTRAFLPLLHQSSDARIVNISSLFGLIAPPGQTAYCASKFAVRGFSESLRHELHGGNIGVTTVHPGGVNTSIAQNARAPKTMSDKEIAARQHAARAMLKMPAEQAGEIIVRGIERRQPRILVGSDAKLISVIERLMPVSYWNLFERSWRSRERKIGK